MQADTKNFIRIQGQQESQFSQDSLLKQGLGDPPSNKKWTWNPTWKVKAHDTYIVSSSSGPKHLSTL